MAAQTNLVNVANSSNNSYEVCVQSFPALFWEWRERSREQKSNFHFVLPLSPLRKEAFYRLALDVNPSTVPGYFEPLASRLSRLFPLQPIVGFSPGAHVPLVLLACRQPVQGTLVPLSSKLVVSLSKALLSLCLVRLVVSLVPGTRVPCCHHVFQ